MRYSRFLALREPVWQSLERAIARLERRATPSHEELEEMALRYRQVLHDHALARTRYPGTGAALRLRRLALAGNRWLLAPTPARRGGLRRFFGRTFPGTLRRHLAPMAISCGLFALTALLGLALAVVQPGSEAVILPPDAVAGLRDGRLWTEELNTVAAPQASSFIATNNLSVALTAWAGGALAGLGSVWIVAVNGLMLGAIVGVTLRYSMAGALLEFVAAHGPLEISLILITAGAGLVMAQGLLVAGDRPRAAAAQQAGRDSLIIVGGCLPWFVLLAVVETLVSPSPELGAAAKVALGLLLQLLFLVSVWRPTTAPGGDE